MDSLTFSQVETEVQKVSAPMNSMIEIAPTNRKETVPTQAFRSDSLNDLCIVQQGYLLKQNRWGIKQLRFFELFTNGQLKYYSIKKSTRKYKESAYLDEKTNVVMNGTEIKF